jgi:hypothetical protein
MTEQIEPGSVTHAAQQRQRASQLAQAVRNELNKALIGQEAVVDDVLTALIAGGHVLLEGWARPCWCGHWRDASAASLRASSSPRI